MYGTEAQECEEDDESMHFRQRSTGQRDLLFTFMPQSDDLDLEVIFSLF